MLSDITFFHYFSWQELLLRLGLAAILGLAIGFDRECKRKPMGVRVMMLVSLTMAALVLVMEEVTQHYLSTYDEDFKNGLRISSVGIVGSFITGLGFLGGAAIIQDKGKLLGVSTGAGILAAGAVGAACGFGLFGIALILAAIILFIITVIDGLRTTIRDDVSEKESGATDLHLDKE